MSNTGTQETKISAKQTNEVEIDRDSIYTEENVKGMLADQEIAEIESEKDSTVARKDSIRVQMLKTLSSPPMSLEAFIDSILEIDKRHASDFHKYYSEVRLEGNPIRKERKPYQLIKREEATDQ